MTQTIEEAAKAYVESADTWSYGCEENHDITEQMQESFKAGANHVYGLPLSQRLTAEEKERVRGIYNEELGMAQHFHKKAKASNDISCRQHYYGLREPYISRMKLLERIFGKDFFKEGE